MPCHSNPTTFSVLVVLAAVAAAVALMMKSEPKNLDAAYEIFAQEREIRPPCRRFASGARMSEVLGPISVDIVDPGVSFKTWQ